MISIWQDELKRGKSVTRTQPETLEPYLILSKSVYALVVKVREVFKVSLRKFDYVMKDSDFPLISKHFQIQKSSLNFFWSNQAWKYLDFYKIFSRDNVIYICHKTSDMSVATS